MNQNEGAISSWCEIDSRVGRRSEKGERLILVLGCVIIGDDNGGALLKWSGCATVAREEHQCHCYCSVIRGCWAGDITMHNVLVSRFLFRYIPRFLSLVFQQKFKSALIIV